MPPKIDAPPEPTQLRVFASLAEVREEVQRTGRRLVVRGPHVYDVGDFLDVVKHPGGKAVIERELGADIDASMRRHSHSASAYEILELYKVGSLQGAKPLDDAAPVRNSRLDSLGIEEKHLQAAHRKLDFSRGLVAQIWRMTLSPEEYLAFVHDPKVLIREPKLFDSPLLDRLTRTAWFTVPLYWIPIVLVSLLLNFSARAAWLPQLALFLCGVFLWTFLEYTIHRFLFHVVENHIHVGRKLRTIHFLFHGIHHAYPLDKSRVVFPIFPSSVLIFGLHFLLSLFLGFPHPAYLLTTGAVFGYVLYDTVHFQIHHSKADSLYMRAVKANHNRHHYRNPARGYGVTSTFWDHVFGSTLK